MFFVFTLVTFIHTGHSGWLHILRKFINKTTTYNVSYLSLHKHLPVNVLASEQLAFLGGIQLLFDVMSH